MCLGLIFILHLLCTARPLISLLSITRPWQPRLLCSLKPHQSTKTKPKPKPNPANNASSPTPATSSPSRTRTPHRPLHLPPRLLLPPFLHPATQPVHAPVPAAPVVPPHPALLPAPPPLPALPARRGGDPAVPERAGEATVPDRGGAGSGGVDGGRGGRPAVRVDRPQGRDVLGVLEEARGVGRGCGGVGMYFGSPLPPSYPWGCWEFWRGSLADGRCW